MPNSKNIWSNQLDDELYQFCYESVLQPWEKVLSYNRGDTTEGKLPPFLGLGPSVPLWILPLVLRETLIKQLLGSELNMITIIRNYAHNHIVFFAAERVENGQYTEMIRLNNIFPDDLTTRICRMLQARQDKLALETINDSLKEYQLERFHAGILKISDLYFFDEFMELAKYKNTPLQYLPKTLKLAHNVISKNMLRFYPKIPLQTLISILKKILPPPRYHHL